jgi:hypothetical protein
MLFKFLKAFFGRGLMRQDVFFDDADSAYDNVGYS